ncbi:MAG: Asp-tRNA(Asn)/Glu-tRNA(Gln) amidotransferase subunit GatA [Bacteriovoracia bacterium]
MEKPRTISGIHDAYDAKKLSPVELTRAYLDAISKSDHNAYLEVCSQRALAQAEAAQKQLATKGKVPRAESPLFGIPLGIKDVLTIEGVATTCGSRILEKYRPPYTATAVERLEKAGAISLGKLNMDEFAMGSSNENSAFGPVKHPTHPDHVPGGSSGGSATAVAAGLCAAALGSDTGGSVRQPASFCGLVGFKPTYGRISRYGLIAYASSLDQVGVLTNTVADAATLFDIMSGADGRDPTCVNQPPTKTAAALAAGGNIDWKKTRVGVPKEYFGGGSQPDVQKAIQSSLDWFKSQGAQLVDISLPHTEHAIATYYLVAVAEASSNLARFDGVRFGSRPAAADSAPDLAAFYRQCRAAFGPEVKRRIILGTYALSSGYYDAYYRRACQVRSLIARDFREAFMKVDVIAAPVSPVTAFKRGEKTADPLQMYLMDIFTIPASLAGLPALSVPCGKDGVGLPIGLHLIGAPFKEESLLRFAQGFEKGGPK